MQDEPLTYLNTATVAKRLGVVPDRIRQLARAGRLQAIIVTAAGQRLYTEAEVERYRLTTGKEAAA